MSKFPVSLQDIRDAEERLSGVARVTPLLNNLELDRRLSGRVFYKPESLQHIGAFKFRGAYNRIVQIPEDQRRFGVVAFSSGNHAQGVACAASMLGINATIVMPSDAPKIKLEGTKALGAEVRLYDRYTESREQISADIAEETGATLVPAFDDLDIIAGQGTVGLEIMGQLAATEVQADYLLSPVGGGGLMAGVSTAVKAIDPQLKVLGVEPEHYNDHGLSQAAGERVKVDGNTPTLCDSLMATTPGELTWSINGKLVDEFLSVSEEDVEHAISFAFRYLKLVIEPGGAVTLAALLQNKLSLDNKTAALIFSGGNIDSDLFARCLEKYPSP